MLIFFLESNAWGIEDASLNMTTDYQTLTDEELLLNLADGEVQALDHLYIRHAGRVLSYARKKGLETARAEDVLQIVFLQLYRKKHLYDPKHAALAWIFVITRSELKDYRKRELKNHLEWEEDLSQGAEINPSLERQDEVRLALNELRAHDQKIVKMRYLEEMEYADIAKTLNESESTIRQRVSRSVRLLRNLLASSKKEVVRERY